MPSASEEPDNSISLPAHVGIIMDGNGRWATSRGLPRGEGHRQGLVSAKRAVAKARSLGIKALSLYVFSTENWKRAQEEVQFLFGLILSHLAREFDFYRANGIRVLHSGDREGLPLSIRGEIDKVMTDTSGFDGMTVNLAINYGGRDELARAVNRILAERAKSSRLPSSGPSASEERPYAPITESDIAAHLDTAGLPDPDLVIRTAGEFRTSNFMLWQSAYSEFHSSPVLWPDWNEADFDLAIADYGKRRRLFGGKR